VRRLEKYILVPRLFFSRYSDVFVFFYIFITTRFFFLAQDFFLAVRETFLLQDEKLYGMKKNHLSLCHFFRMRNNFCEGNYIGKLITRAAPKPSLKQCPRFRYPTNNVFLLGGDDFACQCLQYATSCRWLF